MPISQHDLQTYDFYNILYIEYTSYRIIKLHINEIMSYKWTLYKLYDTHSIQVCHLNKSSIINNIGSTIMNEDIYSGLLFLKKDGDNILNIKFSDLPDLEMSALVSKMNDININNSTDIIDNNDDTYFDMVDEKYSGYDSFS